MAFAGPPGGGKTLNRRARSCPTGRSVVPHERMMFGAGLVVVMQRLPDRDHALRRLRCYLVVKQGQRVDAFNRVADGRIDEYENAVEHIARHAECLGAHHDRFAQLIAGNVLRLPARNL